MTISQKEIWRSWLIVPTDKGRAVSKRSRLLYTAGIVFVVSESARGTAAAKASAAPAETTAETASAAVMVITHH